MQEKAFKSICGQLIGYYRKTKYQTKHSYQFTQRGMIKKTGDENEFSSQKTLCSTTTLRQIESGIQHRNEYLYVYLAKKIDKQYLYSRQHIKTMEILCQKVYHLVEKMELNEMNKLYQHLQNHSLKDYLYYGEWLEVLSSILSFYLYQNLPGFKTIQRFQQTFNFFLDSKIQLMMLHLVCEYYRRIQYDLQLVTKLINQYPFKEHDYLFFYTVIPCLISNHNHLLALRYLQEFKNQADFENNLYKQFYYHHMTACILTSIDFHQAEASLEKCKQLVKNQHHFNPFHHAALYHNLGLRALFVHRYQQAVDYLTLAASINPKIIQAMLPYLFEASKKAGLDKKPILKVLRYACPPSQGLYASYYKYFSLRCHLKKDDVLLARFLENCIIEDILPALKIPHQERYLCNHLYSFFLNELKELNEITRSNLLPVLF